MVVFDTKINNSVNAVSNMEILSKQSGKGLKDMNIIQNNLRSTDSQGNILGKNKNKDKNCNVKRELEVDKTFMQPQGYRSRSMSSSSSVLDQTHCSPTVNQSEFGDGLDQGSSNLVDGYLSGSEDGETGDLTPVRLVVREACCGECGGCVVQLYFARRHLLDLLQNGTLES